MPLGTMVFVTLPSPSAGSRGGSSPRGGTARWGRSVQVHPVATSAGDSLLFTQRLQRGPGGWDPAGGGAGGGEGGRPFPWGASEAGSTCGRLV